MAVIWVGHKVIEFSVGPFKIIHTGKRYAFRGRLNLLSGQVGYERVHKKTTWEKEIVIILAGVIANFIVGVGLIIFSYYVSNHVAFAITGMLSIVFGVINLIPYKVEKIDLYNDASLFFEMLNFKKAIAESKSYDLDVKDAPKNITLSDNKGFGQAQIEIENDDVTPMEKG